MKIIAQQPDALLPEVIVIEAQKIPGSSECRSVEVHLSAPEDGINENTGLMLVSHNWGGTWEMCWQWCRVLSNKFNLICIDTDYYQSGPDSTRTRAYDFGVLQAMDCLRAMYEVRKYLDEKKIAFNRHRNYAAGASGGGNVSQMVNKLAPHTFGCIIDLCGMPGLTDDVAYGFAKHVNAGYSRDPQSPDHLAPHMQEIRDYGNLEHLAIQYRCNPDSQVVIVHGVDDDYCSCPAKVDIFSNMLRAGFKPEGYFITPGMVDGIVVMNTGHPIGDRAYVIARFGQRFIAEKGEFVKLVTADDFDLRSVIEYPVTGGCYRIDFSNSAPEITFLDNSGVPGKL